MGYNTDEDDHLSEQRMAEKAALEAEVARLRALNAELVEALRPFAAMAPHYPMRHRYGNRPWTGGIYEVVTHGLPDAEIAVEHLHAAAAVIERAGR